MKVMMFHIASLNYLSRLEVFQLQDIMFKKWCKEKDIND